MVQHKGLVSAPCMITWDILTVYQMICFWDDPLMYPEVGVNCQLGTEDGNCSLFHHELFSDCLGILRAWWLSCNSECLKRVNVNGSNFFRVEPGTHWCIAMPPGLYQPCNHKVQVQGEEAYPCYSVGGGVKECWVHVLKLPYFLCLSSSHGEFTPCLYPALIFLFLKCSSVHFNTPLSSKWEAQLTLPSKWCIYQFTLIPL